MEISYLKVSCGVTKHLRVTDGQMKLGRERCDVEMDKLEKVKSNTLKWFGRVKRMESDSLSMRIYDREEEGRREDRTKVRWRMECSIRLRMV